MWWRRRRWFTGLRVEGYVIIKGQTFSLWTIVDLISRGFALVRSMWFIVIAWLFKIESRNEDNGLRLWTFCGYWSGWSCLWFFDLVLHHIWVLHIDFVFHALYNIWEISFWLALWRFRCESKQLRSLVVGHDRENMRWIMRLILIAIWANEKRTSGSTAILA